MNSYALAFGILGGGVVLAAILWLAPRFRQRMAVRRFRKSLDRIDLVTLSWSESLRSGDPDGLTTTPPEGHGFHPVRDDPDEGGASLV